MVRMRGSASVKLIFRCLGRWKQAVALAIGLKLLGSFFELLLPYL